MQGMPCVSSRPQTIRIPNRFHTQSDWQALVHCGLVFRDAAAIAVWGIVGPAREGR